MSSVATAASSGSWPQHAVTTSLTHNPRPNAAIAPPRPDSIVRGHRVPGQRGRQGEVQPVGAAPVQAQHRAVQAGREWCVHIPVCGARSPVPVVLPMLRIMWRAYIRLWPTRSQCRKARCARAHARRRAKPDSSLASTRTGSACLLCCPWLRIMRRTPVYGSASVRSFHTSCSLALYTSFAVRRRSLAAFSDCAALSTQIACTGAIAKRVAYILAQCDGFVYRPCHC